ncbi:MAG TPA: ATP-binding protein, partial [Acidimicrobiales bacterium]|nr:ATP-binding protein [Acidimicrobiales bacterium]
FGAGLQLQAAMAGVDPRVRERLQATVDDLDETIRELRAAIFALQGPGPSRAGLRGRLLDVVREAGDSVGFEPRLQFDGAIETMEPSIADNLVAVLREALANVARHARATSVRITVATGDEVMLTVVDDGVGLPDDVVGGRGLGNLADRATNLGGRFQVERVAGGGTRLEWRVPAPRPLTPTA